MKSIRRDCAAVVWMTKYVYALKGYQYTIAYERLNIYNCTNWETIVPDVEYPALHNFHAIMINKDDVLLFGSEDMCYKMDLRRNESKVYVKGVYK